ncbi:hypothetical protein H1P_4610003 [Hyella patelloides LEGE 07179]|uniref:Transposase IS4-like domain-containing protein n=1 Tax=Hyella patelloides LEGE 07179 TaxID=945734 RepID=A0A563VYP6_9CYAN|nr:transposase [Hyella patelloides]VEP16550.1 hypothetical protein H1P_4610003 [Hyella patelloides LEGE 07179]
MRPDGITSIGSYQTQESHTDESDYLPTWQQLAKIIGHKDFLFLADSKASTWKNRALIESEGGNYGFPLAMSQPRPQLLLNWVANAPIRREEIYLNDEEFPIGEGFEVPFSEQIITSIDKKISYQKVYKGAGRGGQNRPFRRVRQTTLILTYQRCQSQIAQQQMIAGWRLYVTNAQPENLTLEQAVLSYREQWQLERGFHRFKRGHLPALPIYFQDEERVRGLMFLLTIALSVFTLMEFVVRRQLTRLKQSISGLYAGVQ